MEENYIGKIKEVAKLGRSIYEKNLKSELEKEIIELKKALKECVDKHAIEKEFSLIVSNDSSKDIKLYELIDRVKSPESLEEKIIRNQEFYEMLGKEEKVIEDILIKKNDDLMGVRFLVSLSCDCERLFELVKKYQFELKSKGIELTNLDVNPQTMQNGRSIYRIKGKYNKYPFELQIKSKVDSAWADIEHMLFYKDYQFSYIQNTNREVMNRLGNLLDKVDELMLQIRESQTSYQKEKEEMEFTQYLGGKFRESIVDIIGSAYILSDYRKVCFSLYNTFSPSDKKHISADDKRNMSNELYRIKCVEKGTFCANYDKIRMQSLEFVLFEHIYAVWLHNIPEPNSEYTELGSFVSKVISALVIDKTEKYIEDCEKRSRYSVWVANVFVNVLKKIEVEVHAPLFVFSPEKLYMLYSYYVAVEERKTNYNESEALLSDGEDKEIVEHIESLNQEILIYMLDKDMNKHIDSVRKQNDTFEELEGVRIVNSDFMNSIKVTYDKVSRTASGKKMPKNIIYDLLGKVTGNGGKNE